MATYSAFFSSGLLAPHVDRCTTPVLPSSPMALTASPVDPVNRRLNPTPTPLGQTSPRAKALEAHTNAERPRLRKRRSSINVGANPMALIKSPVRNAGSALQRTGFMSPSRRRAGSVTANEAYESNSLFGRLRSGSVGGAVNPPKRVRRAVRCPVPPPSAPLPALPPPSPTPKCASSLLPPVILSPMPRRPLETRSPHAENAGDLFSAALCSATLPGTAYAPFNISQGLSGFRDDAIDEAMKEY